MRQHDWLPHSISYSSGNIPCDKSGQGQHSLGQLLRTRHHNFLPDVISYTSTISACETASKWQQALGLHGRMRQHESATMRRRALVRRVGKGSMHFDCLSGCDTIICCQTSSATILSSACHIMMCCQMTSATDLP